MDNQNNRIENNSTSKKIIDLIIGFFIGLIINVLIFIGIVNFIFLNSVTVMLALYLLFGLLAIDGLLISLLFYLKRKYLGIGYIIITLLFIIIIPILLDYIARTAAYGAML